MTAPIQRNESRVSLRTVIAETPTPSTAPVNHAPASAPIQPSLNVNDLLARKLDDPSTPLQSEESIAVLMECIRRGEIEAQKAKDQELVVVIGNTGAGKSTFSNAICGCTMQRISPKKLGLTGVKSVVIVTPTAQGGARDEVMPIGHTKDSKTFIPQLVEIKNQVSLCDCPGFLDNRGYEINIANAANIRNTFIKAKSVKVVILINFHTLEADKARGLRDMIKICCDLFGSKENLLEHKNSILLGITQIPFVQRDEEQEPLEDLKDFIKDTKLKDEFEIATLLQLSERLFIYDPLNASDLKYVGALTKKEVLDKIAELECIQHPQKIFKTVLNDSDIIGLINICDQIQANIQAILSQASLSENDFKKIADYLESLRKLEIIEHRHIFDLVATAQGVITRHFHEMIHRFDHCCADDSYRLADESQAILTALQQGVQYFDREIQSQVNLENLEKRYALFMKKREAKQASFELADLQKNFFETINVYNFVSAKQSLDKIKQKLGLFETEYQETGISHHITLKQLESHYTKTKTKYDKDQLINLAQQALVQLTALEGKLRLGCAEKDFVSAKTFLDEIKGKVQHFEAYYPETGISHNINLKQLENLYNQTKANYDKEQLIRSANKALSPLIDLKEQFEGACARNDFDRANQSLDELKQKLKIFETKYHSAGVSHNINIKRLENLYKTSKTQYEQEQDDIVNEEERQQRKDLAQKAVIKLKALENKFREACAQNDFGSADRLYFEILTEWEGFDHDNKDVSYELNTSRLRDIYDTRKEQYERDEIRREIEQKLEQGRKAAVDTRRKKEEAKRNELERKEAEKAQALEQRIALRNQLFGPGMAAIMATPSGPVLSSPNNTYPILYTDPERIIIATSYGPIRVRPLGQGANRVILNQMGQWVDQ
ncbi:hypothetical protein DB41_CS00020 [Neochlamydia sp. TUME1]|uniref:GTPase domain-containing protein n=1 Tax=Neochlamydia sp. TUME1 TaxID=1478174 RepID=UPI00057D34DA|nr:GTPase [Neochlamydia sp. TUME1]KIC77195.1 hypothetical protein DB41_CS00020 [Neochlamydia sp. TUME1]